MATDPLDGSGTFVGRHPVEIVAAIYGADTITLQGFNAEPMPGSWLRPALRFVSAELSASSWGVINELISRSRLLSCLRLGTGTAFVVALVSFAYWVGVGARPPVAASVSPQWYASDVSAQGVIINTDSVLSLVVPGESLPNGDLLQVVVPDRAAYITNRATILVQKSKPETSASFGAGAASGVATAASGVN